MSDKRTLFGKPTRKSTTVEFFPDKMTVCEFCAEIRDNLDAFEDNLSMDGFEKLRYIESWYETMGAWMEIEEER